MIHDTVERQSFMCYRVLLLELELSYLWGSSMSLHLLTFFLILASRVVDAFSGWLPFAGGVLQGRQTLTLTRDAANIAASRSQQRTTPCRFRAHPNEYEAFFNKACKSGRALMSQLSPEERAQRAIEVCASDIDMRRNLGSKKGRIT